MFKEFVYNGKILNDLLTIKHNNHIINILLFDIDSIQIIQLFPPEVYMVPAMLNQEIKLDQNVEPDFSHGKKIEL